MDFDQQVYGGLQTTDPALIALQLSVLAPQAYKADVDDTNTSGQMTVAYQVTRRQHVRDICHQLQVGRAEPERRADGCAGQPILSAATVKPEDVRHVEVGVKTEPLPGVTANVTVFHTGIKDFQTQVVNAQVGVLRGYLANAEKVRVRGAEFDGTARISRRLSLYGALAYTDGIYVSFPDAPPPLEETGGPQVKDISGSMLPGISKWALSLGGEYVNPARLFGQAGELFGALDTSYRSRSRRARQRRSTWSSTVTAWSTRASVSDGAKVGRSSSGRVTCSTPTTTSSSPHSRATPGSMSGCLEIREPSA